MAARRGGRGRISLQPGTQLQCVSSAQPSVLPLHASEGATLQRLVTADPCLHPPLRMTPRHTPPLTPLKKRCSQYAQSRQFLRHQSQHCSGVGTFDAILYSSGHSGFQLLKNTTGLAGSAAARAEGNPGVRDGGDARDRRMGSGYAACLQCCGHGRDAPRRSGTCANGTTRSQGNPAAARTAVAHGPQVVHLVCERVAAAGRGRRCGGHWRQWWRPVVAGSELGSGSTCHTGLRHIKRPVQHVSVQTPDSLPDLGGKGGGGGGEGGRGGGEGGCGGDGGGLGLHHSAGRG